jgi:hypothetical protein
MKNMKMIRITTTSFLMLSLLTLGACKKTVYNTVDQVFSATYTLKTTDWATTDNSHSYSVSLTVPEVDDKVVADGGVVVYLSFDDGVTFEALPEVFNGVAYGALHSKGFVTIDLTDAVDPTNNTVTAPGKALLAKVVILDGTPLD